jgi:dTDP-4-dehydrorhamnose 3,5-epimerase
MQLASPELGRSAAPSSGLIMPRADLRSIGGVEVLDGFAAGDARGSLTRLFPVPSASAGKPIRQVLISFNDRAGTLRGMHFQRGEASEQKIVSVLQGRILDVVVDLRVGSGSYLSWASIELSAHRPQSLLIPKGLAHGFITLDDSSQVSYLIDEPYNPEAASGIRWNDPAIGVEWPFEPSIVSDQDQNWRLWSQDHAN